MTDLRMPFTMLRKLRIENPLALAGMGVYTGRTRKRVLMSDKTIGGTRYKAGTIINTRPIREIFAEREAWQDRRLDAQIAKLNLQLDEVEE